MGGDNIVEIRGLELAYGRGEGDRKAVGPLDLDIRDGESLGLVGESGAGKSTLGLEILGLLGFRGGMRLAGQIRSRVLPREMALIPQDPAASLDPLFSVGNQLAETGCQDDDVRRTLRRVGLEPPRFSPKSYPHELSGGMRQRILIAMALLMNPRLVVADEPTSSLDTTTQAEVIGLLREIKASGVSFLFITHNLPLAAGFCDRIAVLRSGQLVESGRPGEIFSSPAHEYTRRLVDSVRRVRR